MLGIQATEYSHEKTYAEYKEAALDAHQSPLSFHMRNGNFPYNFTTNLWQFSFYPVFYSFYISNYLKSNHKPL